MDKSIRISKESKIKNCQTLALFGNTSAKVWPTFGHICSNLADFDKHLSPAKIFFQKLRGWNGAKVRKSFRCQTFLQIKCSLARIGLDTAETDPSKVWFYKGPTPHSYNVLYFVLTARTSRGDRQKRNKKAIDTAIDGLNAKSPKEPVF